MNTLEDTIINKYYDCNHHTVDDLNLPERIYLYFSSDKTYFEESRNSYSRVVYPMKNMRIQIAKSKGHNRNQKSKLKSISFDCTQILRILCISLMIRGRLK